MGVYTEINLNVINDILSHYDIGQAVDYQATMAGISNSNFCVSLDNSDKVLLKISNDKTIEQLDNEQRILILLEKYNYEYSLHPFKTIQGKPIYHHHDFYGVVFPFIDGLPPEINNASIYKIARALASLHSLEIHREDLSLIRKYDEVGFGVKKINEYLQATHCAEDFKKSFLKVFPDQLKDIPYDLFPAGIIHGDLYFDNSLFKENDLMTLIDFEQAGRGRFILDIGIAISGSCLDIDGININEELLESFLKGYSEIRELKAIEKEYLNIAITVGFYSIALWRIKRFYEGDLDIRKKYNYRELVQRAEVFVKKYGLNN